MKNRFVKISLASLLAFSALTSCVRDDKYDVPTLTCTNQFGEPNTTIAQIKAMAPTPDASFVSNKVITDDLIFDGYVISSDEDGNFYRKIVLQDSPENPTAGIEIAINKSYLYADYPVGSHIRVKAQGLSVGIDRGVVKLGLGTPAGQIQASQMSKYIAGVCGGNSLEVKKITPIEVNSIAEANQEKYINTLVKINGVQFQDADGTLTYGDAVNKLPTDRTIIDKNGGSMVLRNSGYAAFVGQKLPQTSGSITMVMTQYTSGRTTTWQGYINGLKDVQMSGDRFSIISFNDLKKDDTVFATYINQALADDVIWKVDAANANSTDKYMDITAHNTGKKVNTLLGIPVNFDDVKTISFNTRNIYYTGDVLKVYYSTKYTAGTTINKDDLVEITSNFIMADKNTTGFANAKWKNSGKYTIPNVSGNGYIFFEYNADDTLPRPQKITTRLQLDNIVLEK